MATARCSADAVSNDTMTGEKSKGCAVVFRLDHVVHRKSSGSHCKCTTRLGHGGVANALSNVLTKEQCEICCDDARCVGVSFGHKRCGEQSGDARYVYIEIPEFLKMGIVIRQAEEGPMRTHLIMN